MGVKTPVNVQPVDTGVDISTTPNLLADPFETDVIVTVVGIGTEPDWRVGLSVSQEAIVYGPDIYRTLGRFGSYAQRMYWGGPGGLGTYESFMGIRLRTSAPFEFSTDGIWLDME